MSRRRSEPTVRVWEVAHDVDGPGAYGDGMAIRRFRGQLEAHAFAAVSTCYGREAQAVAVDAPRSIARRWGVA